MQREQGHWMKCLAHAAVFLATVCLVCPSLWPNSVRDALAPSSEFLEQPHEDAPPTNVSPADPIQKLPAEPNALAVHQLRDLPANTSIHEATRPKPLSRDEAISLVEHAPVREDGEAVQYVLRYTQGKWMLLPALVSGAETYIGDVEPGDVIRFGPEEHMFVWQDKTGDYFLMHPSGALSRLLSGDNTLGRAKEGVAIALTDPGASRTHARLELGPSGRLRLYDMASLNGTVILPHAIPLAEQLMNLRNPLERFRHTHPQYAALLDRALEKRSFPDPLLAVQYILALNHPDVEVQRAAVLAQARIRDPRASYLLASKLLATDAETRDLAAWVLENNSEDLSFEDMRDSLWKAAHSEDIRVRGAAAIVLARNREEGVDPMLREILENKTDARKDDVAEIIIEQGRVQFTEGLVRLLSNKIWKRLAEDTILGLGDAAIPSLRVALNKLRIVDLSARRDLENLLVKLGDTDIAMTVLMRKIPLVRRWFYSEEERLRALVCLIKDSGTTQTVKEYISDHLAENTPLLQKAFDSEDSLVLDFAGDLLTRAERRPMEDLATKKIQKIRDRDTFLWYWTKQAHYPDNLSSLVELFDELDDPDQTVAIAKAISDKKNITTVQRALETTKTYVTKEGDLTKHFLLLLLHENREDLIRNMTLDEEFTGMLEGLKMAQKLYREGDAHRAFKILGDEFMINQRFVEIANAIYFRQDTPKDFKDLLLRAFDAGYRDEEGRPAVLRDVWESRLLSPPRKVGLFNIDLKQYPGEEASAKLRELAARRPETKIRDDITSETYSPQKALERIQAIATGAKVAGLTPPALVLRLDPMGDWILSHELTAGAGPVETQDFWMEPAAVGSSL